MPYYVFKQHGCALCILHHRCALAFTGAGNPWLALLAGILWT